MLKKLLGLTTLLSLATTLHSQEYKDQLDSIYIHEVQDKKEPAKVLHAEPLYIDLIRDLGARKGEHEWNLGLGLTDNHSYDAYEALVEYEWAPADRIGLEVELPFTFYSPLHNTPKDSIPSARLNSLKMAGQWSFLVNEKHATSMAIGYIHEFELSDFRSFANPLLQGMVFNPFLIAAKRWGQNFHTLIYTGPRIENHFESRQWHSQFEINSSFHYMIPGTRNFLGLEMNKLFHSSGFDMVLRPQMRLGIADNLLIGIVAGIPISREEERFSTFLRLIWEPGFKRH